MKKLLMLGTSTGSVQIVKYAKAAGIYTVVTDFFPVEKSEAKKYADECWDISTADIDTLEKKCIEENIDGVFAGVSEFNLDKVLELTERLHLPCYINKNAWGYARNKYEFKQVCKKVGAPVSPDFCCDGYPSEEDMANVVYPVVVKPVDKSSNKGLTFVNNKEELLQAIEKVKSVSDNPNVIVERKLHGQEVTAYYAIANGEPSLVSFYSMNSEPGMPIYTYSLTTTVSDSLLDKYVAEVDEKVKQVIKEIKCKDGIAWFEIIYDEDGHFYLLEMGHRLPGDMMFVPLTDVTGFNSIAWLVNYAVGNGLESRVLPQSQKEPYKKCGCSYMLWTKQGGKITQIVGLDKYKNDTNFFVHEIAHKNSDVLQYRPVSIITFTVEDCQKMCDVIEDINKTVHYKDEQGNDMLIYFDDYSHLLSQAR